MTIKSLLLSAAKKIDSGEEIYSCIAVYRTGSTNACERLGDHYALSMSPRGTSSLDVYDIYAVENKYRSYGVTAKKFRVLLILMFRAAYDDLEEKA